MRGANSRPIAIVGERPGFKDRSGGAVAAPFGDAGGAVFRVVGVGIGHAVFDATSHIPVEVVLIGVRRSRFRCHVGDSMRDARAVGIRPREPACRVGCLRVIHARSGSVPM